PNCRASGRALLVPHAVGPWSARSRQAAAGPGPGKRGDPRDGWCFAPTSLVLLASGSRGETRFAGCARCARTDRRESDVTKRAARADPETALLGAAETAPLPRARPSRRLSLGQRRSGGGMRRDGEPG